ncbi:MAG: lysine-specific cysteine proteinase Kgp [bacterium F082]|nr:MAG: lysine-specific cysteine proteinase Kgp [bacterium F082]KWW28686.1 MAG: lysine-specific cysteine proteinase Kgp [bacterium P201]
MKKVLFSLLLLAFGLSAMAQQIQLRSADRVECVKSDMTGLKANFSFSSLDSRNIETTRGELSEIFIEGTYPNGNVGEPQLPMFTRLIAIPTGATPLVTIGAHSETQYTLSDYGIGTLSAMQAPVRKDVDPSTVEYAYNEEAYARDSYNDDPIAMVEVLGTMRGITLGRLIVQPVRYNPAGGTVKVFNDIEVTVDFENGDAESTERMFKSTANVAFQGVYDQIFNIDMLMGATRDAYTDHPDFYNTPVKMLVICYSGFQGNSALESWLQWKLQKGYYVDIYYTSETGTTASAIASFIKTKYNASVSAGNAYTYLVVIGDTGQVPQYMTKTVSYACASDLGYSSVDFSSNSSDYFPDMYYSRMSVENTTHLTNYINKVLTYEKFEMTDGGDYLNNVILVGGWDSSWTSRVAKPTINYATNYYFKSSNTTYGGFENGNIEATVSTSSTTGYDGTATGTGTTMGNGVYTSINSGVGFLNYTAHGDRQEWYQPKMTAAQVACLTNSGKYFFGVGNCCLTGNFNNTTTTYSPGSAIGTNACFAETMIRVPNAGAVAYVGCSPYSYWYEDFYWAVGAHSYSAGNYPTQSASSKGVYDIMFEDQYWNSASALLYLGNLAVQQAVTNGNTNSSITDGDCNNSAHYYFQFYHTFGDGSVMPYITKPEVNTVTIPSTVTPGTTSITVNALAGSYVAVTDNSSVIYGVAEANSSGVATVNFTNAIPTSGTLYVVVTRQQYQPYFGTISIVGGTQYDITCNPTQHGSISAPQQAYANVTVTLTATPDEGYCLSAWDVRDENNNAITVTDNQFTMPESDVTVSATFVEGYTVTLAEVSNGTISANPTCALSGTTIMLSASPDDDYYLSTWVVFKTGDVTTAVSVTDNQFIMPDYDVTVVGIFKLNEVENVVIGSGASSNSYIPTYAYYNYSLTQQIYTSLEIGQAGTITAIAFQVGNNKSTSRSLDVYLSHTTTSSFSGNSAWISQSTSARVFSGSVTFAASGWTTITLDTPFEYNGTSNLLLTVDDNTGSYVSSSSSPSFYVYSASSNTAVYKYNDNTNYDPASMSASGTRLSQKNQVTYTITHPGTSASLAVSPNVLTGFTPLVAQCIAVVGAELEEDVTINAPADYEICASENGTYSSTLTLTKGELVTANVYVRLKSGLSQGQYNETLTVTTGDITSNVSLNGEVYPTLAAGCNWWTPTKAMTLEQLEEALGGNAVLINTQGDGFARYDNGLWSGTLTEIAPGQMYKIETTAPVSLTLSGEPATGVSLTLMPGYNWFGYTGSQSKTIAAAFSGFAPTNGDTITDKAGNTTTYNNGWSGSLTTLEPGHGYVYHSKATQGRTLTF